MEKVILLVGPTCVGKTGASIELARELETEIISADSMQVYRHMDIGTEKPSAYERRAVPHHMIDVVEPWEEFSAGKYVEAVLPIMKSLHRQGRVPLVAGGTGLYVKAMTRGLFAGPEADWELRRGFDGEDSPALHARLARMDPETAQTIEPGDRRRVVRALEVCMKSGRAMSEMKKALTSPLPFEFVKIGLAREREELYRMIDERVDEMIERGLPEEVRRVLAMNPSRTAMQAIGYKELAAHFAGEYPLEEAVRLIKRNTRRYAKRQFTWFKKEDGLMWVDITGLRRPEDAASKIKPLLEAAGIEPRPGKSL